MARLSDEALEEVRTKVYSEYSPVFLLDLFDTVDALRAEQAEAVALAVAGAYLDAAGHWPAYIANPDKDAFIQSWIECSCGQAKANGTLRYNTIWGEHIRSRTPADAKAAWERLEAEKDATIERLEKMCSRWKKAIEGLTPSGSEFVNDPEFCAEYIRKKTNYPRMIIDLRADVERLTAELAEAKRDGAICHCEKCSLERIDATKGGSQ